MDISGDTVFFVTYNLASLVPMETKPQQVWTPSSEENDPIQGRIRGNGVISIYDLYIQLGMQSM